MIRRSVLYALIVIAGLSATLPAHAIAMQAATPVNLDPDKGKGRYIVVLRDSVANPRSVARAQLGDSEGRLGFVYQHALTGYSAVLSHSEVMALRADPRVKHITPDHREELLEQSTPTGINRVFAPDNDQLAIDGEENVVVDADVAVIDTGIDYEHPDLNVVARTYCNGTAEVAECTDDTGTDNDGHGTHVAGTIGAIDNDEGVTGVAPGVRLWAVKVLDPGAWESEVAAGVDWVTAHADEIEVANMSLGCQLTYEEGELVPCPRPVLYEAISSSVDAGVVYVVAAGNDNVDAKYKHPAYHPDVITVSGLADYDGQPGGKAEPTCIDRGDDDTSYTQSNWGSLVEVAAPAVCINSTEPGGSYGEKTGTSMASPHVAGAAAILSAGSNPETQQDVEDIRDIIVEAGNFGWEDTSGDGEQEPLLDVGSESIFALPKDVLAFDFSFGSKGSGNGQFNYPSGIEADEEGNVLVADTANYRVQRFNSEGEYVSKFGSFGTGNGQFLGPAGVAVDGSGNIWVADLGNDRVQKFNSSGEYLAKFGSSGTGNGQFDEPAGIAIDAEGNVWVADLGNNRVQKFNSAGTYKAQFGSKGSGNGQFESPAGVAVDGSGNIWVADLGNDRVQKFNSSGEYLAKFGSSGTGNGQFDAPADIAIDSAGSLWVTDSENNRVQKLNAQGNYITEFGEKGTGEGQFESTRGIAIDPQGDLWVTDINNHRVQKWVFP